MSPRQLRIVGGGGALAALGDEQSSLVGGLVVSGLGLALAAVTTRYYWRSRSRPVTPC